MQHTAACAKVARQQSWFSPRTLLFCTVLAGFVGACRSIDRPASSFASLDSSADDDLRQYEAMRVQSLAAKLQCANFTPRQGLRVTRRIAGQAVEGEIRILNNGSLRDVYIVADFNDWGRSKTEADRLRADSNAPGYLIGKVRKLHHAMEYHLWADGRPLTDPAAVAFARAPSVQNSVQASSFRNAVFWDFERPGSFRASAAVPDLRAKPLVMGSVEVMSLAQQWFHADKQGPKSQGDTYRFVAESGLVQALAEAGYNALVWMPLQREESVKGRKAEGAVAGLYAPDARYGSPDDFSRMVDALNRAGIAVIMETALDAPARAGSGDVMATARFGITEEDHSDDFTKPLMRNLVSDAVVHVMCRYGIGGVYLSKFDEIRAREGRGASFLKELVARLRDYRPGAMIIAQSSQLEQDAAILTSLEGGGYGATYRMHAELSLAFQDALGHETQDVDMQRIRAAMRRGPGQGEAARLAYLTYDRAPRAGSTKSAGSSPASLEFYAERRIKAFASLAFLSNSAYVDKPQLRLLQAVPAQVDAPIDWSLRERGAGARTWDYFADLSRYVTSHRAFAFPNHHRHIENRVDTEDGRRLISLTRRDRISGKCIHVLVNLGHIGYNVYGFGTDHPGSYRVAFDSDAERYGGSGELSRRLKSRVVIADGAPMHGKKTSLSLPYVAPYATVILEQD